MGAKTNIRPQLNCFETVPLQSHRPTDVTGRNNQIVLGAIFLAGLKGVTAPELEEEFEWKAGTVSPRLSELKALGYVRKTEARRYGAAVYLYCGEQPFLVSR